jgi:hypothetical protein
MLPTGGGSRKGCLERRAFREELMQEPADRSRALDRAVVLYVGWKLLPFPQESASRVIDFFGETKGSRLVAEVRSLLAELDALPPDWTKHDLVGASAWAVAELMSRHDTLGDEARAALEWIYSWWWK